MKAVPTRFVLPSALLLTACLCFCAGSLQAQDIGSWDFESGNLSETAGSTLGEMSYADGAGAATQGATGFGTATSFTIPKINGVEAKVMKFTAATAPLGYAIPTPFAANGGGSLVNNYTIVFDLFYPAASSGKLRRLLQTDDGLLSGTVNYFSIDAANGIGAGAGPFHGVMLADTWYRVGFVVDTDAGLIRKYINGLEVGTQSSGPVDNRNALPAVSVAKVLSSDDANVAAGYVNSIQIRDAALTAAQMRALGEPSAAGIPIDIPPIPSFIDHWIPRGLVASRNTDIGAVIYSGETFINLGTISLKLDGNVLANPDITPDGLLVTVRKANPGVFTPGTKHTIELKYTDDVAGQKTFTRQFTAALLFEDFEELVLGPNVEEAIAGTAVWTKTPPEGWVQDDTGVPGVGDPGTDGKTEWAGWSFANKAWWVQIADDQNRSQFVLGEGTVAIADPDEWDDAGHPNGPGIYYNTFLNTPEISLAGVAANTVFIKFASSWRPEGFDDGDRLNNQTATVTVSYDGGPPVQLLKFDSDATSPTYHPDATSEQILLSGHNPAGATKMVVTFGLTKALNDWWWAFDNLEINAGPSPPIISTQPQSQLASAGATIAFDVEASGSEPLSYQWKYNNNNLADGGRISGAHSASLVIANVQAGDVGQYSVVVNNAGGTVTSDKAVLSVSSGTINQDLVVHLAFEDNFDDTSGLGLNGTPIGAPSFVTGVIGKAMHIGSTADYVALGPPPPAADPSPAELNFGTDTDHSFSFWTRAVAWTDDPAFISNKNWDSGSQPGYVLATDSDGHFQWNLAGSPGTRKDYDGPPGTFSDHAWHHVVVTFDRDGSASTYIDGILRNTAPLTANQNNVDTPAGYATCLGQDGRGTYGPRFTDMDMDDLGIWRRVLTVQEVASIYDQGVHGHDLSNARGDVSIPVSILTQPAGQIISAGSTATLRVGASGSPPLRFQWQKNGVNISGATRGTLNLANAQASDTANYRCIVSNPLGTVPSTEVRVAVFAGGLADNLVVWLKFEDDYSDCSGRGNHASPRGPSPDFAPGKVGEAFHFTTTADGSTINYATLGQPADLHFGTSDFSVSFWINYTEAGDDPPFISNKDWGSSSNIGWGLFHQDPTDYLRVNATGTPRGSGNRMSKTLASPPVINDGSWHHLAASFWRGQTVHTYVDGQLVDTTPLTITGSVDPGNFAYAVNIGQDGTGGYTDGGGASINALIDEVLLYRRAITPQDVAAIYTAGSQGRDPFLLICNISVSGGNVTLNWKGASAPYTVQHKASLSDAAWDDVTTTSDQTATFPAVGPIGFFRVVGTP